MGEGFFIGIDVGTGSARAALVNGNGEIVKIATRSIKTWNPKPGFYEQSSEDIWRSCASIVKEITSSINPEQVKGVGFDATCSLVAIGSDGTPVTISPTGNAEQNVVLWMDHRAFSEADFINRHRPEVLRCTGGTISLEMQTPKLMWLKKNLPDSWKAVKYFFDLSDFLTWKATGDDTRSLCTTICKWTFMADEREMKGWDRKYFSLIDLEDLLADDARKIGKKIKFPGERCGQGFTESAANDFNLLPGTPVGISLIDAHSGGLGLIGCTSKSIPLSYESRIALICGTSSCHMTVSKNPLTVPGVWGPYFSAMLPNMWLNEAGQSATGKLIDYIIETHPASLEIQRAHQNKCHIQEYLNMVLKRMAQSKKISMSNLTNNLHIWPDFHGNRSPLADPSLKGMICGLTLLSDEEDLAVKYLAAIQALAYGTRHIIENVQISGNVRFSSILMCGGLSKNEIFVQTHADVLNLPVLLPKNSESVLLGAAMLASVASGHYQTVDAAIRAMAGPADVFLPNPDDITYHSKKFNVFLKMVKDQKSYDQIMA